MNSADDLTREICLCERVSERSDDWAAVLSTDVYVRF